MVYLAWFDGDRKKSSATKIAEGVARYREKFNADPVVILVHPEEAATPAEFPLRPLATIGRNCYWIGADDDTSKR